jgi:ribonucleoside-triphosphate reductase
MIIEYSYHCDFKEDFKKLKKEAHSDELMELDGIGRHLDVNEFSRSFFSKNARTTADVSVDANANIDDVSVIQYEAELAKPLHRLNAYYLLWKYGRRLFGEDIAGKMMRHQFHKDLYINDFHRMSGSAYCFNFSCMDIVYAGLPFVKKIHSGPPKHLTSFMGQIVQFVTYASNSIAGAVGLADLLICASHFVYKLKKENKKVDEKFLDKIIKQELQSFIYSVNQPFRGAQQSPFTNVSLFDDVFLTKLCKEYKFPDGSNPNKDIIKWLQEMFIDLMNETLSVTPATFPVTTACFAVNDKKEILDKDFLDMIAEKNLPYGFMNIYAGKTSTLSSCCRLRSEAENEYFNMFGSGGTKIGSCSVVTLNLPRLAYTAKDRDDFLKKLAEEVELISQINHVKRYIVQKRIDNGNSPLYDLGFMDIKRQYSTCGLAGINETVEILGLNILEQDGQEFVKQLLETVNDVNDKQQKKYGYPHNAEQVPAENSAIKLADADKILGYNKKYQIYSNQFIPLTVDANLYDRLRLQGLFDSKMTGGAICHLNIADKIEDKKFMKSLITEAINLGVIYFAVNYNIQKCIDGHMAIGSGNKCQICGKKITDNFTRVVGFLVNTKNWHYVRRKNDYPKRVFYDEKRYEKEKEEINKKYEDKVQERKDT